LDWLAIYGKLMLLLMAIAYYDAVCTGQATPEAKEGENK
jgi:hypothetical protein